MLRDPDPDAELRFTLRPITGPQWGGYIFDATVYSVFPPQHTAVREWCETNATGEWGSRTAGTFHFYEERDAVAFKLRWC